MTNHIHTPTRWVRAMLVAGALALPGGALAQEPSEPDALTLDHAVELALQNNRTLASASIEVAKFDDRVAAMRTKRLPSFNLYVLGSQNLTPIDFTFERGVFGTFPDIGPVPSEDTTISTPRQPTVTINGQITQPLSKLFRIGLEVDRLEVQREMAKEDVRAREQEVVASVKQAYFAILQTQSALESARKTIELNVELDRVTEDYVARRVVLKSEGLDVKTRLAQSEYDAMTLGDQLATQQEQLNVLLGRDVATPFRVTAVPEYSLYEVDLVAARSRALDRRPEVNQARLKVKDADFDRRIKKSERIPDVSLAVNYVSLVNYSSMLPRHVANVGVAVTWEVFDWGRKKREIGEKEKAVDQAEVALRDAQANVVADVNAKYRKLEQTKQLLKVARLRQDACVESARVATARYSAEAALLKDVLQAQSALVEANSQYQQALLSFWTAKADLEKAIGDDR